MCCWILHELTHLPVIVDPSHATGVARYVRPMALSAAACGADRALVICSPDPVCVRSASSVRQLLDKLAVTDRKLVINRFNGDFFDETGAYRDLDCVIDAAGLRLFGLVPEDITMAAAFLTGQPAPERSGGMMAMARIAARLEGKTP